ncbi:Uncharacterised protein [Orientia tsutsugamushi]|nr:hypothetical protein OTSTA763_0054 [Orientia tsutsugamushi str. TA763]SPP25185.1 Uncharacterised protein [Orientia tsutsugamushi]
MHLNMEELSARNKQCEYTKKALKRLNITYKKSFKTSKSKKEEGLKFQNKIKRYTDKGKVIIFTGESSFVHSITLELTYCTRYIRCLCL